MSLSDAIVENIEITATDLASPAFAKAGASARAAAAEMETAGKKANSASWGAAVTGVGKFAGAVGLVTTAAAAFSVDAAVKLEDHLQKIQGNTGSTTAQMAQMRAEVLRLGAIGPQSLDQIATGFEHAANEGYHGAQAMQVVDAAWKAAIATGGQTGDMVNTLSTVMRNFHEPTSNAAKDMGILMVAAQQGNIHLPELAQNFSKLGVMASSIHMPLADVASAYSELTRSGLGAAASQTALYGMLLHMIAPTKGVQTEMAALAKTTGIDLTDAFKKFSEGQMSFTDVMKLAKEATHGNAGEIFALFGGIRGGLAALKLMGEGWNDYLGISAKVHGSTATLNTDFANMQKTVGAQMGTLKNNVTELAISVGDILIPQLVSITADIKPVVANMHSWAEAHPAVVKGIAEVGLGALALAGGIKLVTTVGGPLIPLFRLIGSGASIAAGQATAWATGAESAAAGSAVLTGALSTTAAVAAPAAATFGLMVPAILATTAAQDALAGKSPVFQATIRQTAASFDENSKNVQALTLSLQGNADKWAATDAVTHQAMNTILTVGPTYKASVDQMDSAMKGLESGVKDTYITAFTAAEQTAKSKLAQINSEYTAHRDALLADMASTTSGVKRESDAQAIAQLDSWKKARDGVIAAAEAQAQGVAVQMAVQKDSIVKSTEAAKTAEHESWIKGTAAIVASAKSQTEKVYSEAVTQGKNVNSATVQAKVEEVKVHADTAKKVLDVTHAGDMAVLSAKESMRKTDIAGALTHASTSVATATSMNSKILGAAKTLNADYQSVMAGMRAHLNTTWQATSDDGVKAIKDLRTRAGTNLTEMAADWQTKGKAAGDNFKSGVSVGLDTAVVTTHVHVAAAKAALDVLQGEARGSGAAAGAQFAAGLASEKGAVAAAAAVLVAAAQFHMAVHSPTLAGVDFYLYGQRAGEQFAQGLASETGAIGAAAKQLMAAATAQLGQANADAQTFTVTASQVNARAAAGASEIDPGMAALTAALQKLPPDFSAAGTAVVNGFQAKMDAGTEKFKSAMTAEDNAFAQKLGAENTSFSQKMATENARHEQAVTTITDRSNRQLDNYLKDHAIKINAANQAELAAMQAHNAAYLSTLAGLNAKLAADEAAGNFKKIAADEAAIAKAKQANDDFINKHAAALGIHTKEQKAMLEQWLANHKETLNQALAKEAANNEKNIAGITAAHAKHIEALIAAHNAHVAKIQQAFNDATLKLAAALKDALSPSALVAAVQKQVDAAVKNATDQLVLDFLETGTAVQADIDAYTKAAAAAQKLTEAQTNAAQAAAIASGNFTAAINSVKTTLSGTLQTALDHYALDLMNHTGDLAADAAAIVAATQAQKTYDDAVAAAAKIQQAAIPVAATASAAQTKLTAALDQYAQDMHNHTGDLNADSAAIKAAQGDVISWAAAVKAASDQIPQTTTDLAALNAALVSAAVAAGDYTSAVNTITGTLNTTLNNAINQYAYDLVNNTGSLAADTAAILAAKAATDTWSAAVAAGTAIANQASQQASQTAIQLVTAERDAAINTYLLGIMAGDTADQLAGLAAAAEAFQHQLDQLNAAAALITNPPAAPVPATTTASGFQSSGGGTTTFPANSVGGAGNPYSAANAAAFFPTAPVTSSTSATTSTSGAALSGPVNQVAIAAAEAAAAIVLQSGSSATQAQIAAAEQQIQVQMTAVQSADSLPGARTTYQNDPIYLQLKAIYDQLVGIGTSTKQTASSSGNADVVKWLRELYALEKAGKGGVGPGTDWAAWLRNLGLSSVSLLTSAAV